MADLTLLEALQALHQELVAVQEGRADPAEVLNNEYLIQAFESELNRFWSRPSKRESSRAAVKSGRITVGGNEFSVNEHFQQTALTLADEVDLDELEASQYLLESQEDPSVLGRSLLECAIIRFHRQRNYALDALRLLLEMDKAEDEEGDDEDDVFSMEAVQVYVAERIFTTTPGASTANTGGLVPRCMKAMQDIRSWLQKLGDKLAAAQTLGQAGVSGRSEEAETVEFSRISLTQQHELLGVILCRSVVKRQTTALDFMDLISTLRKVDKYDNLLIHLIPATGAYINEFASIEGGHSIEEARKLDKQIFPTPEEPAWALPYLQASIRAWWLAEYSGFYLDDPPAGSLPPNVDLDHEDRQRTKQFQDSLREGAFDFLLSVAGDVKSPDWHDSVRTGMHRWLQRKSPTFPNDCVQFSEFFQLSLVKQLEIFVDGFITNLPDVLRKLRVEEDEQRQLSQMHEQDLDLERFLLIIAYAYEGRSDAQHAFWADADSNLNGFLHWASRRASTPLVTAFCEMLQAISLGDRNASDAHKFLLDDGNHSTGKMRRSQSLTWNQIFRELNFFLDKAKQKPTQPQTLRFRGGKIPHDVVETEPESAMMLESYLRLITKLATESETTRQFFLQHSSFSLIDTILELTSTPVPPRLRGCCFTALRAMLTRKTVQESHAVWTCLETWITGGYAHPPGSNPRQPHQSPVASMDKTFDEISQGFDDPESFTQLLLALVSPAVDSSTLNDALPFPENLGASFRAPGIDSFVDYVIGLVFAAKSNDLTDVNQIRVLRLGCLDFILTCLSTFNEDLIIMANQTNLNIDATISATDLSTYVKMHPFARIMEWMFNDKVMTALFNTIHQEPADVGNAAADSPLILGILRAVEVISKVLDLQSTYLDLVRPLIRQQSSALRQPAAKTAYASFEDGLVTRLGLVVDLGNYVGIGHPELTLACLKLLERMSCSSKITAVWSASSRHNHRNKAIVAMEANGEHEAISRAFISELTSPLDVGREAESSSYMTKIYILNFLYQCLKETPTKPTIAHLILGFKCGVDSLTIESNESFDSRTSLFHSLLRLLMETPSSDARGIRHWLVALKTRAMRVLHVLWSSNLSSSLAIEELRENEFLFHLLVRETIIHPGLPWEGQNAVDVTFPMTNGSATLLDFLSLRSMTLEYIAMELCMISQGRMPSVKRRIFEALNGQVVGDSNETIRTPTVFDLYDCQLSEGQWHVELPPLQYYKDLDLTVCLEKDEHENSIYNIDRVQEIMLLKQAETRSQGILMTADDLKFIKEEESMIVEYLISTNRQKQLSVQFLFVLKTWIKLLLVMVECNDFKGTAQTSFFLQALQAILPGLEAYAADRPDEAMELAKLAKVLLFKLYLTTSTSSSSPTEKSSLAIGNLVSEKLYQVFQICLQAVGKLTGTSELRSLYYEICYRYLTGMTDQGPIGQGRAKTVKTIQMYGERLINVICDDAYGGEPTCQSAALVLLGTLVNMDRDQGETHVVDALNRLNFIGILVDSLRNVMQDWHEVFTSGNTEQKNFQNARLSLLLNLAQSRLGAKHILHANLLPTLSSSGLFSADPELLTTTSSSASASSLFSSSLPSQTTVSSLEAHYDLLAKCVRIIGAAILARGSHNVVQGRKFLTENRMLVTHVLKRSAGIAMGDGDSGLGDKVAEVADGFVIIIAATGFLEFENEVLVVESSKQQSGMLFH